MVRHIAIVPAGGQGSRFGGETPKQFLPLLGIPLIGHTLNGLLASALVERAFVVMSPGLSGHSPVDFTPWAERATPLWCAGAERSHTVLHALEELQNELDSQDWVLVHDAARPCLRREALERLLTEGAQNGVGGILAVPVADTLKREHQGEVEETVNREGLWRAQTPQMFRYGLLLEALRQCRNTPVTDEAQAMERLGYRPRLVMGDAFNLKVTWPEDLQMAEWILKGGCHD
jgi:2-C-methyl-D-erythritol 4-phosphate cytidylyltransferase